MMTVLIFNKDVRGMSKGVLWKPFVVGGWKSDPRDQIFAAARNVSLVIEYGLYFLFFFAIDDIGGWWNM